MPKDELHVPLLNVLLQHLAQSFMSETYAYVLAKAQPTPKHRSQTSTTKPAPTRPILAILLEVFTVLGLARHVLLALS